MLKTCYRSDCLEIEPNEVFCRNDNCPLKNCESIVLSPELEKLVDEVKEDSIKPAPLGTRLTSRDNIVERIELAAKETTEVSKELLTECIEEIIKLRAAYYELILAVGNKYPGETRHQTALRYIKCAELQPECNSSASSKSN